MMSDDKTREPGISVEEAKAWVAEIEAASDDPEAAHASEDSLWVTVLKATRDGADNSQELAEIALKTTEIGFPRWYA